MSRKATRNRAPARAAIAAQARARELAVADLTVARARADLDAAEKVLAGAPHAPAAPDLADAIGRFRSTLADFEAAVARAVTGLTSPAVNVVVDPEISAHLDAIGLTRH